MRWVLAAGAVVAAAALIAGCGGNPAAAPPVQVVGSFLCDAFLSIGGTPQLMANLGFVVRDDRTVEGAGFTSAPVPEYDIFFTGSVDASNHLTASGHVIGDNGTTDAGTFTLTGTFGTYSDGSALTGSFSSTVPGVGAACTVAAATDVITTVSGHGLSRGSSVLFVSTTNGITAGTTYYVLTTPSSTTFTISTAPGGSSLDITGDGTNTVIIAPMWRAYSQAITPLGCYMGTYTGDREGVIAIMNWRVDDTVVMIDQSGTSVHSDYFAAPNILTSPTQPGGDYGLLANDSWYLTGMVITGTVGATIASGSWQQPEGTGSITGTWSASRPAGRAATGRGIAAGPLRLRRVRH